MNGRSWMLALILFLPAGCTPPLQESDRSSTQDITEDLEYPFARILRDANGRELEAEIHGRSNTEVFLIRKADAQSFRLPISKLSEVDRQLILNLPIGMAPNASDSNSRSAHEQAEELLPAHLRFSYRNLNSIFDEIEELVTEIQGLDTGTMRRKSLSKHLSRMKEDLESASEEFFGDLTKHLETLDPQSSEQMLLSRIHRDMDSKRAFAFAAIKRHD